ncbi:MAG: molybdate ABC transporter substrate-binding protein [Pseudoxanthomonas suwonensis]|nr:molybdate ABC transporter substrate-binding protein [Pseudoxanthomonas suwonensis]
MRDNGQPFAWVPALVLVIRCVCLLALLSLTACSPPSPLSTVAPDAAVRVHAAASLAEVMEDAAGLWEARGHPRPEVLLAGSSTLARQINAGAPGDVFVSADVSWMDAVEQAGRLRSGSRVDLVGNRLVLIAPRGRVPQVQMLPEFAIADAFEGRLCTGEPGVVPIGIHARDALQHLRWWDALQPRIVGTDDVRAALNFVERGECALGIVYATDAAASDRVDVVGEFPVDSHGPVIYPMAVLQQASDQGEAFARFLRSDAQVRAAFERRGFRWLDVSANPPHDVSATDG